MHLAATSDEIFSIWFLFVPEVKIIQVSTDAISGPRRDQGSGMEVGHSNVSKLFKLRADSTITPTGLMQPDEDNNIEMKR